MIDSGYITQLIHVYINVELFMPAICFKSYYTCLYGVSLWSNYAACTLLKFKYGCHKIKCIKCFVYSKSHSITSILLDLKLLF